jgi:LemA protein
MEDEIGVYIAGGLVLVLLLWVILTWNRLITLRNHVRDGKGMIDVYLLKRWQIIPGLVSLIKGYQVHERTALERMASARTGNFEEQVKLSRCLNNFRIEVEAYPDLKSLEQFEKLMDELKNIEEELRKSRRYYNGSVERLRTFAQRFPNSIVAGIKGKTLPEYFNLDLSDEI